MWTVQCEEIPAFRGRRLVFHRDSRPASFAEVLHGWREDADFRTFFNGVLRDAPCSAFRWETPPVTANTLTRPFECVLLDSPSLARQPEPEAFAEHFVPGGEVVSFTNLGGDAVLIVPCPLVESSAYGHLAAFVRHAPEQQQQALWRAVGAALRQRLSDRPVWLSTAGAGVSWLHVRLDSRPKYYGYTPYRTCSKPLTEAEGAGD